MITLKVTHLGDAAALAEIQKKAFMPLYEIYRDEKNPALRGPEDILCRLDNGKYICRNILFDGVLVGCVFFRKKGNGEYYLQRIFIDPGVQSRGIATEAILLCETEMPDAVKFTVDFPEDN
jgi:RimJ/RimL family protein N-acetyltransferase